MKINLSLLQEVGVPAAVLYTYIHSTAVDGEVASSASTITTCCGIGIKSLETAIEKLRISGYITTSLRKVGHGHGYSHNVRVFTIKKAPNKRQSLFLNKAVLKKYGYLHAVVFGYIAYELHQANDIEVGISYAQFNNNCGVKRKALTKAISDLADSGYMSVYMGYCLSHKAKGARFNVFSIDPERAAFDFQD